VTSIFLFCMYFLPEREFFSEIVNRVLVARTKFINTWRQEYGPVSQSFM